MSKQSKNVIIYALICISLFVGLMYWTNRLFVNNYIKETFTDGVTHTVNMPINSTISCKNMCGPPNRCSITGTQCLSDIDCYGCQPNSSPELSNTFLNKNKKIYGYSQAGKLSFLAPEYSSLVHDIGTRARSLVKYPHTAPPQYNKGVDTWSNISEEMKDVYNETYKPPSDTLFIPNYPTRPTATGEYKTDGPFASNATLTPAGF